MKVSPASAAFFLLLLFLSLPGKGQELSVATSISTPPATAVSVDRKGDFYLAFNTGTLSKYDANGHETLNFSPERLGKITLIDAWNPLRLFLFYEDFQSILILDRFLTPTASYDLSAGQPFGFIKLACPSQDHTFWLIDESYKGLIKYDPMDKQVVLKMPFNSAIPVDSEVLYMREYQNLLFVSLRGGGLFYFDNLGNYLGKIGTSEAVRFFGFIKNQVYFLQGDVLQHVNLYLEDVKDLSLPAIYEAVVDTGKAKVGVKKEGGFDLLR